MKRYTIIVFLLICVACHRSLKAQVIFVDPVNGNGHAIGTSQDPVNCLDTALAQATRFTGTEPVKIILRPGLYTVTTQLRISAPVTGIDIKSYSIEAAVMPDDTAWQPAKMPVIQCVADSNRPGRLPHASTAFYITRNHVSIRGLKFVGNANPLCEYYYAIERRDSMLTGLKVSQCLFVGDKNGTPIQGGIFAQGAAIQVDHCIFHGVKNAVMAFLGLKDFSLTYCIIDGAYEGAVWYGYGQASDSPFSFDHNVIMHSRYVFIGKGLHSYVFSNSLFLENAHYLGFNNATVEPDLQNKPKEVNITKSGKVILNEITEAGIPRGYLHISPQSAGGDLKAGIFIKQ